jgi:hypothetical protein
MNWKWALFSSAMLKASNLEFTTKSGNLINCFAHGLNSMDLSAIQRIFQLRVKPSTYIHYHITKYLCSSSWAEEVFFDSFQ